MAHRRPTSTRIIVSHVKRFVNTAIKSTGCMNVILSKKLSREKREEFVKENRLCFNCLREGHSSRYCTLTIRCKECNKRHNTVLHRDNLTQTEEKKPAEPAATAMCAYSKKSIAFPIVAVTVTAAGKKIDTLAVFDQYSLRSAHLNFLTSFKFKVNLPSFQLIQ